MYSKICALVVLLAFVHYGIALQCYTCVPNATEGSIKLCDMEKDWVNTTCPTGLDVCLTGHGTVGDNTFHAKSCAKAGACDDEKLPIPDIKDVECAECSEDLCNSALSFSTTLLLPALCLFAVFKQYL